MNINVDELVLTGKLSRDVTIGTCTFTLASPTVEATLNLSESLEILAAWIVKITDNKNKTTDDTSAPEKKKEVVEMLKKVQGGMVLKLLSEVESLNEEQGKLFGTIKK